MPSSDPGVEVGTSLKLYVGVGVAVSVSVNTTELAVAVATTVVELTKVLVSWRRMTGLATTAWAARAIAKREFMIVQPKSLI